MKIFSLTLAALAAGSATIVAEEKKNPTVDHVIIVTAERRESEQDRSSSSVEVVDREDAARLGHPLGVSEFMQGLPGVDVLGTGGGLDGGTGGIRLRGGRAQDTRYLLDGIPLNDPLTIDGSVNAAFLPGAGLERIEIVKGAQSGLYGSNAVGGVVNMLSLRPIQHRQTEVLAEGGSFGTEHVTGNVTGPITGSTGYALGVDLMNSNGFSVSSDLDAVGDPGHHESDSVRRAGANGRVEFAPCAAAKLYVGGLYQAVNQEWDDYGDPEDAGSLTWTRLWRSSAGGTLKPMQDLTIAVDSAYTSNRRTMEGTWSGIYDFATHEQYVSARATLAVLRHMALTMGGDGTWDQAEANYSASDRTVGAWGQAAFSHDLVEASATVRRDQNRDAGGATTYRLGAAGFTPQQEAKLHATLGTGFVTPTLDQRYATYPAMPLWFFAATEGNADLAPERSLSRDAGVTVKPLPQLGLNADVTAFRTDYSNKIVFVYGDIFADIPNTYQNLTQGSINGVEASLVLDDKAIPVKARVSATWQSFEDESDTLQRLLPNRKARGELGYAWPVLWAGIQVDAVDKRWNRSGNDQALPGYALLGATVSWNVVNTTTLYVRGSNLLDTKYEINPGYSTMPRAFFGGVTSRF